LTCLFCDDIPTDLPFIYKSMEEDTLSYHRVFLNRSLVDRPSNPIILIEDNDDDDVKRLPATAAASAAAAAAVVGAAASSFATIAFGGCSSNHVDVNKMRTMRMMVPSSTPSVVVATSTSDPTSGCAIVSSPSVMFDVDGGGRGGDIVPPPVGLHAMNALFDMDAIRNRKKRGDGYLALTKVSSTPSNVFASSCTLLQLCAIGNLLSVKEYVSSLSDPVGMVNFCNYDCRTALHVAALEGHLNDVQYLLLMGASVRRTNRWGGSPLNNAHCHRHVEVARYLGARGASTGSLNANDALIAAAENPGVFHSKFESDICNPMLNNKYSKRRLGIFHRLPPRLTSCGSACWGGWARPGALGGQAPALLTRWDASAVSRPASGSSTSALALAFGAAQIVAASVA
jgi:hypothetical protein